MLVKEEHKDIVKKAMITAAGVGATECVILPGIDTVGIGAIWTSMIIAMVKKEGHEIDMHLIAKVVTSIVVGGLSYVGAQQAFNLFLKLFILTPPGLAVNILFGGVNSVLDVALTYRLGVFLSNRLSKTDFTESDFRASCDEAIKYLKRLPQFREFVEIMEFLR
jgi:hypothetical protein